MDSNRAKPPHARPGRGNKAERGGTFAINGIRPGAQTPPFYTDSMERKNCTAVWSVPSVTVHSPLSASSPVTMKGEKR